MQFTIASARFNIHSTVQAALVSVVFATSLVAYKTAQHVQVTGIPFADPDQRTVILTAAMGNGVIKDVQPVLPIRRLDLTAVARDVQPVVPIRRLDLTAVARDVQPVVPIRRISLPANWARELQPVEPLQRLLRQIDLT